NLFQQLSWAANRLNLGYYGYKGRGLTATALTDGVTVRFASGLNPGTVALQYLVAQTADQAGFAAQLGPDGIRKTYRALWGDPFQYTVALLPPGLRQPELKLPFAPGQLWYY